MSPPRIPTACDGRDEPGTLDEAREIQSVLAARVRVSRLKGTVRFVAGADASFTGSRTIGVIALFDLKGLEVVETSYRILPTRFPYVPGYLSFREGPALVAAFRGLMNRPDVLMCDGQGIAHPRGLGLASHLGVLLDLPTIGCAKSRLVGEHAVPPAARHAWAPLILRGRTVGAVLRTRAAVRPLFVSPGHRITLQEAVDVVISCSAGCRVPEPLRVADAISRKLRRELEGIGAVE